MMDLTAIATPFGLLDDATREALKAHGGPLEWFCTSGWKPWSGSIIPDHNHLTIRVKPQPPKPREVWVAHNFAYRSEREAIASIQCGIFPRPTEEEARRMVRRFREVLD